jgi:hypothetical protein
MHRSIALTLALAVLPVAAACDKSGADAQAQANEAQQKANTEITNANVEANGKAAQAQSEADKKVAAVQGDFAKTREDYRHKVQTNLDALNKDIDTLDAKAHTATGSTKAAIDAKLPSIRMQRDAFVADFRGLDRTVATTWDAASARIDKEWTDLRAAVDHVTAP